MVRIGVLASGRGSNLQSIMDAIQTGSIRATIEVVVSDKAEARALERAREAGIPAEFVDRRGFKQRSDFDRRLAEVLDGYGVDLAVLAGFMRVLGPGFVDRFPRRIMNIHPSLLPAFPGLDAQQQAIDHGVKVSGCTVHFVDHGVDTGPIIIQRAVPVLEGDTVDTLAARILVEEHQAYPEAVRLFAEGRLIIAARKVRILAADGEAGS